MNENQSVQFMIGEIHAIVKSHHELLQIMSEKLAAGSDKTGVLEKTVAMLAKVSSENSGIIKDIQNRIGQEIKTNEGIVREINELKKNQITLPVLENIIYKSNETLEKKAEEKFSIKLVQKIVFAFIGTISIGVVYALMANIAELIKTKIK